MSSNHLSRSGSFSSNNDKSKGGAANSSTKVGATISRSSSRSQRSTASPQSGKGGPLKEVTTETSASELSTSSQHSPTTDAPQDTTSPASSSGSSSAMRAFKTASAAVTEMTELTQSCTSRRATSLMADLKARADEHLANLQKAKAVYSTQIRQLELTLEVEMDPGPGSSTNLKEISEYKKRILQSARTRIANMMEQCDLITAVVDYDNILANKVVRLTRQVKDTYNNNEEYTKLIPKKEVENHLLKADIVQLEDDVAYNIYELMVDQRLKRVERSFGEGGGQAVNASTPMTRLIDDHFKDPVIVDLKNLVEFCIKRNYRPFARYVCTTWRDKYEERDLEHAVLTGVLGNIFEADGEWEKASECWADALRVCRNCSYRNGIIFLARNLYEYHEKKTMSHDEALRYIDEVLKYREEMVGDKLSRMASDVTAKAYVLCNMERRADAHSLLTAFIARMKEKYNADNITLLDMQIMQAKLYMDRKKYMEAKTLLYEAVPKYYAKIVSDDVNSESIIELCRQAQNSPKGASVVLSTLPTKLNLQFYDEGKKALETLEKFYVLNKKDESGAVVKKFLGNCKRTKDTVGNFEI